MRKETSELRSTDMGRGILPDTLATNLETLGHDGTNLKTIGHDVVINVYTF